ncbi:hypothetical protein C3387_21230 [Leclercia sp. LSNIH6]|nr:hypothetical protein C3370_19315 [Leclercia sp. LSNIH7]POU73450.1 hypothetical protein C3387_21230 [Leclercia sp. LSNIH6]POW49254.1 hypothetical protein C3406_20935 [Leclercia sp. LSNIH8]
MTCGCRVGHQPASMQAMPSRRVPTPRPGLQSTPQRFSAGPGSRCGCFAYLTIFAAGDLISGYVGRDVGRVRRSRHPAFLCVQET